LRAKPAAQGIKGNFRISTGLAPRDARGGPPIIGNFESKPLAGERAGSGYELRRR
jgi:hypothetical protein